MKKIFKISSIIFLIFTLTILSSCSSKDNNMKETNSKADITVKKDDNQDKEEFIVEERVLLDEEEILIVLKSFKETKTESAFKIYIENNTDTKINILADEVSVNGIMMQPYFGIELEAGKKSNGDMSFNSSELKKYKIDSIKNLEFKFSIYDSDSWKEILRSDLVVINTSEDQNYEQKIDDNGEVIFEENGFKMVFRDIDYKGSYSGPQLKVFLENKTDYNVIFQVKDVSVNGFMVKPVFSATVASGKVAYDAITFFSEELEKNGIESFNEVEFKILIFDSYSWDNILESSVIKFSIE